jgi:hypothetical protein
MKSLRRKQSEGKEKKKQQQQTTNNNNAELRKKDNVKDYSWKMRKEEVGENLLMLIVVEAPSTLLLLLYITGVRPPSTSLSTTPTKLLCSSI